MVDSTVRKGLSMVGPKESSIEAYLVSSIEGVGGECLKLEVKGRRGWPDRICVLPGVVFFVECKRPVGGRLSAMQKIRIRELKHLRVKVFIISTRSQVDDLIKEIMK